MDFLFSFRWWCDVEATMLMLIPTLNLYLSFLTTSHQLTILRSFDIFIMVGFHISLSLFLSFPLHHFVSSPSNETTMTTTTTFGVALADKEMKRTNIQWKRHSEWNNIIFVSCSRTICSTTCTYMCVCVFFCARINFFPNIYQLENRWDVTFFFRS